MKKNILIFSIAILTISLMAMGLKENITLSTSNINPAVYSDFNYSVGPRFAPITKSELKRSNSVNDFNTKEENKVIETYESTAIIIIKNERRTNIQAFGETEKLNEGQLKLLSSLGLSSHFQVRTDFLKKNKETGEMEYAKYGPHYTIVPEKQAQYSFGKEALLLYLKEGNKENTANLNEKELRPAMLYFTITKKGKLVNANLDHTSGNATIDKAMLTLLTNASGEWIPAENAKGEKVDQELVIAFGVGGC